MATIEYMPARLTPEETEDLRQAVACLEGASFAQRLTDSVGRPAEMLSRAIPQSARRVIAHVSETALRGALRFALRTLDLTAPAKPANRAHKLAAAASGAVGGAMGLAALPLELPISTMILLRSIAEIAREEGEDLRQPEAALACLEVFALGGEPGAETALESGYFAVRAGLAQSVSESARFLLKQGLVGETAPALLRLLSQIAARFGMVVTEKLAAQAAPVVGAFGGAAVNAAFAHHFQALARGHFTVRRLERKHGAEAVRFEYERLRGELTKPAGR